MNLKFVANKSDNKIEVCFDKEKLSFSLDEKNNVNNDDIITMLTNIAKEISAGNFDKKKNIETLEAESLGELKGLYEFIYSLFDSFIDKFNEESQSYQENIQDIINKKQASLKREY